MLSPNRHLAVSKDEWGTKEDTGKSMKKALHVLRYVKRHVSGQSNSEKNQAHSPSLSVSGQSESLFGLSFT